MKEKYTKPRFVIENFVMTDSIATSCGTGFSGTATHGDISTCGYDLYGDIYWNNDKCNTSVDSESDVSDIIDACYNGPAGGVQIFAS